MAVELASQIVQFAKSLPPWQQILARLAFDLDRPVSEQESEIEIARKRFLYDKGLSTEEVGQEVVEEIASLNGRSAPDKTVIPKLSSIGKCKHINAIANDQTITFSPKLTIIYGENASGKSGYMRLLSSVFHSRGDSKILPNILKPEAEQGEPEGEFLFETAGEARSLSFPKNKNAAEFQHFACFDSKAVFAHLKNSNELYVMPPEMDFFERLSNGIKLVINGFSAEVDESQKQNRFLNQLEGSSPIKNLVSSLSYETDIEDLKNQIGLFEELKLELYQVEKEYHALRAQSPESKLKEIQEIKNQLEAFRSECSIYCNSHYNATYIDKVKGAVQTFLHEKKHNQEVGASSFKTELFKTLGSESWKNFIISADVLMKEESEHLKRSFPGRGDHCPLCLQELQPEALSLFERYFGFLESESEKTLKNSERELDRLMEEANKVKLPSLFSKPKLRVWLEKDHSDQLKNIDRVISEFLSYLDNIKQGINAQNVELFSLPLEITEFNDIVSELVGVLDEERQKYDQESYQEKLNKKECLLTQLRHRKIIALQFKDVESYIKELQFINRLSDEISKRYTKPITEEHKRIFKDYFNKQYTQHFHDEAKNLDVDFHVDITPAGEHGRTSRKLSIIKYSPDEILSEGQQTVLALADFLTEIKICGINGGVVFDDPVNSLDHQRKAMIARRLIEESMRRQVVILTHDIGFLSDLKNAAERASFVDGKDVFYHWVSKSFQGEPGMVTLNHKRDLESSFRTTEKAEEYLAKAHDEKEPLKIEDYCRQGFSYLRQTYEAFIIYELFGGTVRRYDRQVRYASLKKVFCPQSFINEVSEKLGYCSGFTDGHLGVDQNTGQTASPQLLKAEINSFKDLQTRFKKEKRKLSDP